MGAERSFCFLYQESCYSQNWVCEHKYRNPWMRLAGAQHSLEWAVVEVRMGSKKKGEGKRWKVWREEEEVSMCSPKYSNCILENITIMNIPSPFLSDWITHWVKGFVIKGGSSATSSHCLMHLLDPLPWDGWYSKKTFARCRYHVVRTFQAAEPWTK